jgi:hypothetical protein
MRYIGGMTWTGMLMRRSQNTNPTRAAAAGARSCASSARNAGCGAALSSAYSASAFIDA